MNKEHSYIQIKESSSLQGVVSVEGAKNSFLPIIMATLLVRGISVIHHVPNVSDVYSVIELLEKYNVKIEYLPKEQKLIADTSGLTSTILANEYFNVIRTSTLLIGAIIKQFKECWIGYPGGDAIGARPIDIHLEGFSEFGISHKLYNEYVHLKVDEEIHSADYYLPFPSVGATQNLLLLASQINGTSILRNAAQEPEVYDLIEVLEKMGAKIESLPGSIFVISGRQDLVPFEHTLMPDRLEATTFLIAAAATKGSVHIPNAPAYAMRSAIYFLRKMGHEVIVGPGDYGITFYSAEEPKSDLISIRTMPYSGFATDYQSLFLSLLSVTSGQSSIQETIFEDRMSQAYELNKMGANISIKNNYAIINGVKKLEGTIVNGNDIRGVAALMIAGLAASGTSVIYGLKHLLRGYANLDKKLRDLGAQIEFVVPEPSFISVVNAEIAKSENTFFTKDIIPAIS
jgi:UDP-N-acetylglucosamine 1-carboxyvinyltransferase